MRYNLSNKISNKKGYLLSISAIILFFTLYQLTREVVDIKEEVRLARIKAFPAEKIGYIKDDISRDIGILVKVETGENITIIDNLSINKTNFFSNYPTYVGDYGNLTGTNISLDSSDPLTVTFSNNLTYSSPFNSTGIVFKNSSGTSVVSAYYIYLSESEAYNYTNYTSWNWTVSGTYVLINYTGTASNFSESGYVNASITNNFTISYASGNITIQVGNVDGNGNSFKLNQAGQISLLNITATVPETPLSAVYNIPLNITFPKANYSSLLPA